MEAKELERLTAQEDLCHAAFRLAWSVLSVKGECDGLYGAEYRRVLDEWARASYPPHVEAFIRERANKAPQSAV